MSQAPFIVYISDMSCQHCVKSVSNTILELTPENTADIKVDVSLEKGQAKISGVNPEKALAAIIAAGFDASLNAPSDVDNENCEVESQHSASTNTQAEDALENIQGGAYLIHIEDMTCSSCVANVEKAALAIAGVQTAAVNLLEKKALITGGDKQTVVKAISDHGYQASLIEENRQHEGETLEHEFILSPKPQKASDKASTEALIGDTPNQAQLESLLSEFEYSHLELTQVDKNLYQLCLKTQAHPADILLVLSSHYEAAYQEQFVDPYIAQSNEAKKEIRQSWLRSLVAGGMGAAIMVGEMGGYFPALKSDSGPLFWGLIALICLATMIFSGKHYYISALKQAKYFNSNMDTLVAMGTFAAWLASLIVVIKPDFIPGEANHLYFDASVMILAFLQFGHALEIKAKRTTSEAIGALVKLKPKQALIVREQGECILPVSALNIKDVVRVKPGEHIPCDGIIIEGNAHVDEAMISGESRALKKSIGDKVIAGTINQNGSILCEVSAVGEDTTLSHIIEMVKNAQISKPQIGRLVDKISSVFVPTVILISLVTFFAWLSVGPEPALAYAISTAIAVLVIACPCALGLATPIAIMVATARAAQLNILVKNSDALQSAANISVLVVDKTGTLTEGKPSVETILPFKGQSHTEVLKIAASLEQHSEHPLARAILECAEINQIDLLESQQFKMQSGLGISALIDTQCAEQEYFLGNVEFIESNLEQNTNDDIQSLKEQAQDYAKQGATAIWLGTKQHVLGLIIINDQLRHDTLDAIKQLHAQNIDVIMCSGDNHQTAQAIADKLGIKTVHSQVLPEQKLALVSQLQYDGHKVGMVGDGINDAPALAKADTSFAIGSGTDVAISHGDLTLASSSIMSVNTAISLSKQSIKNIKQNLFGAFIYNTIGIPLAAGVFFPITGWLLAPMFASFAMAMSSLTVVTNANRLRFFKPKNTVQREGLDTDLNNQNKPNQFLISQVKTKDIEMETQNMSETTTIEIQGMSCQHCVANASKALNAVDGVEDAQVDLDSNSATVTGTASRQALVDAVNAAGYEAS